MNKYPKPKEVVKSIVFTFSWTGNRIPENIIVPPNNKKVKVIRMREGVIWLEDGGVGAYKRTVDNNTTNEHAIQIEIEE